MTQTSDSSTNIDRDKTMSSAKALSRSIMPREMLLEAARRARWDALYGPPRLRSGRFDADDVSAALKPPRATVQGLAD